MQRTEHEGSAALQGALWSTYADGWAEQELRQLPIYEHLLEVAGAGSATWVLDVGCGAGALLRAAADRGARVAGIDAAPALAEIARARVPEAEIRVGDLQFLPYPDASFDVLTGCNAFQFATDFESALREAQRVTRPGGSVVIQVWGRPERCDLGAVVRSLAPLLPVAPPSGPRRGGDASRDAGRRHRRARGAGVGRGGRARRHHRVHAAVPDAGRTLPRRERVALPDRDGVISPSRSVGG